MMRNFLRFLALALAAVLCGNTASAQDKRPNIVLIVVEDLSPRIGAFGDPVARTPNLDQLAREGVRFTRVFTAAGVCAPSRSALITGMHQHTIGTMHMRTGSFDRLDYGFSYQAVPPPHVKGFPEYLRAGGYTTLNNSKTDFQFGDPSSIWDASGGQVSLADRDPDKPFFYMLSNGMTHESRLFMHGFAPREPGDPAFDYRKEQIRNNAEQNAREVAKLAYRTRPEDVTVPPYLPDTAPVRQEIAQHYDNVQRMDAAIGKMLAEIEAAGEADNTIIIWTTDHGDGITRGKRTLYDSGLHVPMIVRWPDGRDAGSVVRELVSFVDLAPTILSLADIPIPDHLQGRVFLGNDRAAPRDYIYAARDRLDEMPERSRAIRDARYKFIRNYDIGRPLLQPLDYREHLASMQELRRLLAAGELDPKWAAYFQTPRPREELFDLAEDPQEVNNRANDPALADVKARLAGELDAFLKRYGDMAAEPEIMMVHRMWPGGEQPATAAPVGVWGKHELGADWLSLASPTEGASIEYRAGAHWAGKTGWLLYSEPFEVPKGITIEARAIRYGYKPSEAVPIAR